MQRKLTEKKYMELRVVRIIAIQRQLVSRGKNL